MSTTCLNQCNLQMSLDLPFVRNVWTCVIMTKYFEIKGLIYT